MMEVNNPISFDFNGKPTKGGINDQRMGVIDKDSYCKTCNCKSKQCPGHFGYIPLVKPVFHVYFIKECLYLIKCICQNCSKILIKNEDYQRISKINNEKQRKKEINNLIKSKKLNKVCGYCHFEANDYKKIGLKIYEIIKIEDSENKSKKAKKKENEIKPEKILDIFTKISKEDSDFLGFKSSFARPEWMIIKNLLVCPPAARPSVSVDSNLRAQDDLTNQYNEILKINKELTKQINKKAIEIVLTDLFDKLQFSVATLINNHLSIGRSYKSNGEPIKCLFSRINGKQGLIRENLMGKRDDFTARSVISPDPNLQVDEIGIPLSIAKNLTYPELYFDLPKQKEKIKKFLKNTKKNSEILAKIKKEKNFKLKSKLRYPEAKYVFKEDKRFIASYFNQELSYGDIVERELIDGDIIVFNRQPSLHKMSMMGFKVKILPFSTFRLNLSVTTPFNADFDGDEMNLHLPQSLPVKSEIKNIIDVSKQIISPQSNRPIMGIVQDSLVGCTLFTSRDTFLTYEEVMNIINLITDFDFKNEKMPIPCIIKPKPLWSGKQIFSLILPKKLNFSRYREETPENLCNKLNILDNFVEIKNGELYQGIICKNSIGPSCSGGIIDSLWKINKNNFDIYKNKDDFENGEKLSINFMGNCQKIINEFLLLKGFSAGISDTLCAPDTYLIIKNIIKDMKKKIKNLLSDARDGKLSSHIGKNLIDSFEDDANTELNNASSKAGKLVTDSLLQTNNFYNMVSSGSKGKLTNISQIMAFVGQQNVEGKRISFDFKDRTLPHFLKNDYETESKGFIENSFIKGLNAQEFFFHAKAGREGIIDTAVKTSQSGYTQRCLIKSLEDIKVEYDGTVRNSNSNIIQFIYGEDGIAGEYIENQNFETLNMDDETLEEKFKFSDENLRNYMKNNPELHINEVELRNKLNDEFIQIKKDRDDIRNILKDGDDSIHIPVNFKKIIMNAEKKQFKGEKLNPNEILEEIIKLKNELKIVKGDDNFSKEAQDCALFLFHKVLHYSLSTKNIILNHKLNKDSFKYICEEIKLQFFKSIVNPGEMVGCLAAQSIGEPATQMTLNTFHLAGVSSVNITLGIPRLVEILNISKNMNTPSMSIYLRENNYTNKEINKILEKIEYLSFNDVVEKYEIYYDPDIKNSIIEEDLEMVNNYLEIEEEKINQIKNYISPWVLRIFFNEEKLINISLEKIEKIIKYKAKNNCLVIHIENKMQIRLISPKEEKKNKKEKKEKEEKKFDLKSLDALRFFQIELLSETPISGIKKIKKIYIKTIKKFEYKKKKDNLSNRFKEEYLLETEGSNLSEIFGVD